MRPGVRVHLALAAAVTASGVAKAHDLVTPPHTESAQVPLVLPRPSPDVEPISAPASADRTRSAVLLDLRSAVGLPLGEATSFATSRGALDVVLGYLTASGRYAGVTAGASALDSSISGFHETTFQFGIDLGYRPPVRGRIEPWIGLGFAWQILWLTKADFYMKAVGPEFPIVRLGADYRLTDGVALGPFAAFAYRRYDPFSVEGQTPLELMGVTKRDAWIMLGLSASLRITQP